MYECIEGKSTVSALPQRAIGPCRPGYQGVRVVGDVNGRVSTPAGVPGSACTSPADTAMQLHYLLLRDRLG